MFGDSITLSIDGVDRVFTRVNNDAYSFEYRHKNSLWKGTVLIRLSTVKKGNEVYDRRNVDLTMITFATPTTLETVNHCYFVYEGKPSDSQPHRGLPALFTWASANTFANLVKMNV